MSRSRRRSPLRLLRLLLVAILGLALAGPALAPPAVAAPSRGGATVDPGTYTNPLRPKVPGDGTVDSCADPSVIRGQQEGDRYWYMYCTTDPLNDDDWGADGRANFRKIPTMRSTDLVNWEYVGEAFSQVPSWAASSTLLWAPDIVYSEAFDRYYLTFVVTDTRSAVSGESGCTFDTAIGLATSSSPTGPWTFSPTPLVPPRRNGPGCNFFFTFDPDVLGDGIDTESHLYYGGYYGGIYGTKVTVTATGMTVDPATTKQVTIPNRYEGRTSSSSAATTTCSCPRRTAATAR